MKRIVLIFILSLMVICINAQITSSSVKKVESDSELISLGKVYDSSVSLFRYDTIYYFYVHSDNQFEDKSASLKLGGITEAINSLKVLDESWEDKANLRIQGYLIFCLANHTYSFSNSGQLEYTAGNYWFNQTSIKKGIKELEKRKK